MSYFAVIDTYEIVSTLYSPISADILLAQYASLGKTLLEIQKENYEDFLLSQKYYYKNGALHPRPMQPNTYSVWNNDLEIWQIDMSNLKNAKSISMAEMCKTEIISGFVSNALGADHLYPSNAEDQANLSGTVLMSTLSSQTQSVFYLFKCKNAAGVWDFRPHSAAQVQQVGAASYNFILAARVKNATLQAQIQAATTLAQVEAIQW